MAKKPSIAVRLERAAFLSLFAVHGLSGARRLSACAKKSPAFAGLIVFKYDPVASLSAPAGRGQKFVAEKSPLLRLGVSRLHGLNSFYPAGTLGLPPAEPQGRRVHSRHSVVPDSQQMVWPPLPVPASMLRVSSLILQTLSRVRFPHHTESRKSLPRTQANPVPVHGCRGKTVTCGAGG